MKTKVYGIRLTDEERKRLEKRAKKLGLTLAAYIRYVGKLEIETSIKNDHKEKN